MPSNTAVSRSTPLVAPESAILSRGNKKNPNAPAGDGITQTRQTTAVLVQSITDGGDSVHAQLGRAKAAGSA